MRKLNGITINGEFLGRGVVVNGMFRAICAISPAIMREFVLIINKIEALDEAVKISNFNCDNDNSCMDIEFENRSSKGVASLYFKLCNGEPELVDCKLVFNELEYSTLNEKYIDSPLADDKHDNNIEDEKKKKLQALKEAKLAKLKKKSENSSHSNLPVHNSIPDGTSPPATSKKMQKMQELIERKRKALEENNLGAAGEAGTASSAENGKIDTNSNGEGKAGNAGAAGKLSELNKSSSLQEDNPAAQMSENGEIIPDTQSRAEATAQEDTPPKKLSLDDFTDEELAELSLEELEQLQQELDAEDTDYYAENKYDDTNYAYGNNYAIDMAEKLSQGIAEGITQGLTQGLVQGLSEGLSKGLSNGLQGFSSPAAKAYEQGMQQSFGDNFDNSWDESASFNSKANNYSGGNTGNVTNDNFDFSGVNNSSDGFDFYANDTKESDSYTLPASTNIDSNNYNDSLKAKGTYSFDENSDIEELSEYYSDFYDNISGVTPSLSSSSSSAYSITSLGSETSASGSQTNELERLKAELAAIQDGNSQNKMSLDEYMARQKAIEEAKEKLRRKKIRIVGSRGRVNAKPIQEGIYVSGSKVYKWGDVRYLE